MSKKTIPEAVRTPTGESVPVRILYLENDLSDFKFIQIHFKREQFDFILQRAETREEFLEHLSGFRPDCVLLDYHLPLFNGLEALKVLKEKKSDIPVIMISGLVGEEQAVECIKLGADDFVTKENLQRLGHAIEMAIEKKKKERNLKELQWIRSEVLETISDGIVALDSEWNYTYINRQAALMLNRKNPEDLLGKHIWTEYPEGVGQPFYHNYLEAMKTQQPVVMEDYYEPWDRWFENRMYPSPNGLTIYFTEITRRKRAEEDLRRKTEELDRYFESSLDLLCIADTEGHFRRLNPEWERTLGYPVEELIGKQFLDFVHPTDLESTREAITSLAAQKEVLNFVNRYQCKDGSYRWIEWRSYPEGENIFAVARDITQRKVNEMLVEGQRQVLEMIAVGKPLQESLDRLLQIVELQAPGMLASILLLDEDRVHVRHAAAPSLQKGFIEAIDGSPIGPAAGSCGTAAYLGKQVIVEDIISDPLWADYRDLALRFDLRACWSTPVFDQQQKVLGTFALYFREPQLPGPFHHRLIDLVTHIASVSITKTREQETLLESERYNRFLFESSPTGLALCRMDGSLVDVNPAYAAIIGRSVEETEQLSYWDITPEKYREQEEEQLESLRSTESYGPYEKEYIHANGHLVPVRLFGRIIELKGEKFIWSSAEDITEQKRAEEKITSLNKELLTINRVILNTTKSLDLKIRLETILDEALAITGLEGGTICLVNPDDTFDLAVHRETSQETIDDLTTRKIKIGDCLCGNCAKDCKPLILHTREEVLAYSTREVQRGEDIRFHAAFPFVIQENSLGVLCVFTRTDTKPDESDLKLLETIVAQTTVSVQNAWLWAEVKTNEQTLSSIYNTVGDMIFHLALEPGDIFRFVSVNPVFTELTGLKRERIIGKTVNEVLPESSRITVLEKYREAIREHTVIRWEETFPYPAGQLTSVVTIAPVYDKSGHCTHLVGSVHDITQRKNAEDKIRANESRLRLFVDHSPAAIAMFDREMNYIIASRRYLSDYDLGDQDLTGRSHYEVFPEMPERWKEIHRRCLAGAIERAEEDPFPRASGKLDWIRWEIHPWYERSDEIGGIILFSEVITERKLSEDTIRESEERYRNLFDVSPDALFVLDATGQIRDFNLEAERRYGYNRDEMLRKNARDLAIPELKEEAAIHLKRTLEKSDSFEWRHQCKNGQILPVEINAVNITLKGQPHSISSVRDLSERKKAEQELIKAEEKFSRAFFSSPAGISITRVADGTFLDVNDAFLRMFGFSREETLGRSSAELGILTPEWREQTTRQYREAGGLDGAELVMHTKSGKTIYLLISASVIEVAGEPCYITSMIDITERKQGEELLRTTMNRLIQAEENLRKAAAQQLHDQVGQNLTALIINMSFIRSKLSKETEQQVRRKLTDSLSLLDDTITRIRDIMTDLRPSVLDDYGLFTALRWSTGKFTERTHIPVKMTGKDLVNRPGTEIEYALYRMTQEALHNVVKHAQATRVFMDLKEEGSCITLTISDNGVGFDPEIGRKDSAGTGFGLSAISERMKSLGGRFEIQSEPGKGTTLILEIKQ